MRVVCVIFGIALAVAAGASDRNGPLSPVKLFIRQRPSGTKIKLRVVGASPYPPCC